MICPACGTDNLPGVEECSNCQHSMTPLDRPAPHDRIERSLMEERVRAMKPNSPVTVPVGSSVRDAIEVMLRQNVGAALVVDEAGSLVGILSERDLLKKVASLPDPYAPLAVKDYMTASPETVTPDDTLAFALHKMDVGGYRHLPVLAGGKPAGVISVRDLLKHVTRLCKD